MKKLTFKALLPPSVDLPKIWEDIPDHKHTHLGGESGKYSVIYQGEVPEGLAILEIILTQVDEYEINLRTFQEVENGKEKEEEAR